MALQYEDPLKRVMPRTGATVQNIGGMARNTAPIANRPVAAPAVRQAPPGPAPAPIGAPVPPPLNAPPGAVMQPPAVPATPPTQQIAGPPIPNPNAPPPTPAAVYGPGGGGAPSLEDQIRGYITGGLGGVTSKAFIDRAKNQLGSAVEGQRAQGVRRINEDAIRRGLFQSGIPAEGVAAAETGARSALSSGIADILSRAEQQDIAGRESAAGTAGNLLGMNRQLDQYNQERADQQAARAAAGRRDPTTFEYQDPDTGETYTLDEAWF